MLPKLQAILKWAVVLLLTVTLLGVSKDALRFNPAEAAVVPYRYDLVGWHITNFFSKWVHRAARSLPWNTLSSAEKQMRLERYFDLGATISNLQPQLEKASAGVGAEADAELMSLQKELERARSARDDLRNDAEELVEGAVSGVVLDEGLGSLAGLIFPPVDIRLAGTPKVLVTSPRSVIARTHDVLLRPDIKVQDREAVEDELLGGSNLSALVLDIGGVATYPASLPNNQPLHWTLQISAHEWLHHYFFFRPLGQNIGSSSEMHTLNETAANLAGREIGDRAFEKLGGSIERPMLGSASEMPMAEDPEMPEAFDFDVEMHRTRMRVDELLEAGRVERAEAFMEERRRLFVENGFPIRKLNQAYFAFYGTYADSPASVSPIGDQLQAFRDLMPSIGEFIRAVSAVSSYEQFLEKLAELGAGALYDSPAPCGWLSVLQSLNCDNMTRVAITRTVIRAHR